MTIKELRELRAKLIAQARAVYDKAKQENRTVLNTEERAEYDKHISAISDADAKIREVEQAEKEQADLTNLEESLTRAEERRSAPPGAGNRGERHATPEYREVFDRYFRGGVSLEAMEQRGHVLGTDASGGYLALPVDLRDKLLETIDDLSGIHRMATHIPIGSAITVRLPKISARGDDADWTTEIATVTADTALAFGKMDLSPVMLTKLVKISRVLLNRVASAQLVVIRQLGRLYAVTFEKAALTGTGSAQPLGIFTASANGISTGRDVSTGNTQTEITYEGLVRAKYSIKQAYLARESCKWIAHPDFMVNVLLLVDNDNRPIFVPGSSGREDTLLGKPIMYSEFAPRTYTTGQYVAAIGDINEYYIADGDPYAVQVVDQLYAATNEIGFFARTSSDGKPGQEEAFARVKLA